MRTYVKPEIMIESFQISDTIADCGAKVNFKDNACFQASSDMFLFSLAMAGYFIPGGCDEVASDGFGVCYHSTASMAFTS